MKELKRYLPLLIAGLTLVLAFVLSFTITKGVRLKKLRAAYQPADSAKTTEAADSAETKKTDNGKKDSKDNKTNDAESESQSEENAEDVPLALTSLPDAEIETMPESERKYLVVLNIYHKMSESYEPAVVKISEDSEIYLEKQVAEAYREMAQAASQDGISLTVDAGYISIEKQERMFQKEIETYTAQGIGEAEARVKAAYTVLPPRCSEANYGLSVDFSWTGDDFTATDAYVWLRAHAAEYGFVERYTADKENITRVKANPAHWRYVGPDASVYLRDYNVSLEEYTDNVN